MIKILSRFLFLLVSILFFSIRIIAQPGCPSINAGVDQTICNGDCANLTSTYLATGATSSYAVSSIAYAPPYAYNAGTPLLVNIDDRWSSALTIPFTFCFFGTPYTQLVAGSNGCITFNTGEAGLACAWSYTVSCPDINIISGSTGPYILGPYHDIDPAVTGDMYYNTYGSYPCRTFVVSWNQIAMFSGACNALLATHMIVMYESTNVIEVYVQNAPVCASWNSGNKCIGIQNAAASVGYSPPGRNTGAWSASNEAWRFTPNGASNYVVSWWQGATQIAAGATTTVCPAVTTPYTAQIVYTNCNGALITVTDPMTVNVSPGATPTFTALGPYCVGAIPGTLPTTSNNGYTGTWSPAAISTASAGTTTYTFTPTPGQCASPTTMSVTINASTIPTFTALGPYCQGDTPGALLTTSNNGISGSWSPSAISTASTGTTVYTFTPSPGPCASTATMSVTVNATPVATATPATQTMCTGITTSILLSSTVPGSTYTWTASATGGITGSSAGTGSSISQTLTNPGLTPGTVTYTVTPSASGCTGSPITVVVTVNPLPVVTATPASETICTGGTTNISLTSSIGGTSFTYSAAATGGITGSFGGTGSLISQTLTNPGVTPATVTYTITPVANFCTGTPITVVVTVNPSITPTFTALGPYCVGATAGTLSTTSNEGITGSWSPAAISTATAGTATYTFTPTAGQCATTAIMNVTINAVDDPSFNYSPSTLCQTGTDVSANITGGSSGTFTSTPGGLVILNSSTGLIDVSASAIGTYTITFTTSGICPSSSTATVSITTAPLATFSYAGPYCLYDANPFPVFGPGASGGVFSASPAGLVFVSTSSGEVDLAASTPGTYTITNTIAAGGGCSAATATNTITINPTPTVTVPADITVCNNGAVSAANFSSTPAGGTFAWTNDYTSIGLAASGTGNIAGFTATNAGSTPITATITVIPTLNGCAGTPSSYTITVNPTPVATATPPAQTICSDGTTSITLSSTVGGTTFSWTASATGGITGSSAGTGNSITQTLTNPGLSAGTVTYTITPTANTCSGTPITVVVTVNPNPSAVLSGSTTICSGSNTNLQVNLTGASPWTFTYNDGTGDQTVTLNTNPATITVNPTVTTTYTAVSVFDANCGGPASGTVTINVNPDIVVTNVNTGCNAPSTQYQVTFEISGGAPSSYTVTPAGTITPGSPYTFTSNWITSGTAYSFTISDSYNCNPQIVSGTINCACLATATLSGDATICDGDNTNLTFTFGGMAPWSIVYTDGTSTFNASGINTSPYTVSVSPSSTTTYSMTSVTDANCTGSANGTATITVNPLPDVTATPTSETICSGGTTGISLASLIGGTTFAWTATPTGGITGSSAGTGSSITQTLTNPGTTAGTVIYTITPTANTCVGTPITVVVTVNANPTAVLSGSIMICSGSSANLQVNLTGTGPWTFTYNDGADQTVTLNTNPATISVNPSVTTTYVAVSLSDANCNGTASGNATIDVDPAIVVTNLNTGCNVPSTQYQVTFDISGGDPASYNITPAGTLTPGNPYTFTSNWINSGIPYSFTVTDSYNCNPQVVSGNITCGCLAIAALSGNATICEGSSTNLTFTLGGMAPWNIVYTDGTNSYNANNINTSPYTVSVSPTTTTTYSMTSVTDVNCTGSVSGSAVITVNPLPIATATPSSQSFCTGGTTTINLTSTIPGTTFAWTASSSGAVTGFSSGTGNAISQTLTNNGVTTETATYVIIPTANSCDGSPISVIITVEPAPDANAGTDQIICSGQNANLTAFGGGTYAWSNSSMNQSTNVTPTTTTIYTVTVTSAAGCTDTDDVQVTVNPLPPASADVDQGICIGSSTTLNASGGIQYSWSPTLGLSNPLIANPIANPTITTTYTVTVTDANGCSASDDMILGVYATLPADAGPDQTICFGQSTPLSASGGVFYDWSPGTGLSSTTIYNPDANPTVTTTYTVTVSDANGCSASDDVVITVNSVPTSDFTLTSPVCVGQASDINYTGTASPTAMYSWDFDGGTAVGNGPGPYQVTWNTPSTYSISLTVSENGCTSPATTLSQVVGQATATIAVIDSIFCYGDSNGTATVTVTGVAPYQYLWSNMQMGATAQGLSANILYTVVVSDSYGCTASQSVTLNQPTQLTMNFATQDVTCFGGTNGSATATVSGGTLPYTYDWLPAGTAGNVNSVSTLHAGNYTLTISDAHGCSIDTTFTISEPAVVSYTYVTDSVNCNSGSDGSICFTPSGGNPPYAYTWNPNVSIGSCATNLSAGTYYITISDRNGCDTTAVITIGEPNAIILTTSGDVSICNGQSTTISCSATGGTGTYTFSWDIGLGTGNSFVVNPLVTTTYTVSVTDGNGCTAPPQSLTVTVSPPINVIVSSAPSSLCYGESTDLTAQANGGNGNYIYTWGGGIGVSGSTVTVIPTATTTYPVTVTDNCNSPQGVDSVTITVFPLPQVQFTSDTIHGCEPLLVNFSDMTTPAIATWMWDFGDPQSGAANNSLQQDPYHLYNNAGTYTVSLSVTSTDGCDGNASYQNMIEVYPTPDAYFGYYPEYISVLDPNVNFYDMSTDASTWSWNFGDPATVGSNVSGESSPAHHFSNPGTYYVTLYITSPYGCVDSTAKEIIVNQEFTFYMPNAFTPEGNGKNDFFYPKGEGWDLNNYGFYVFDRWGEMIFETNDYNEYWDGKDMGSTKICPQGVYTWLVIVKDFAGETHTFNGFVTLLKK
jgi:gliding motility-associated-like protein